MFTDESCAAELTSQRSRPLHCSTDPSSCDCCWILAKAVSCCYYQCNVLNPLYSQHAHDVESRSNTKFLHVLFLQAKVHAATEKLATGDDLDMKHPILESLGEAVTDDEEYQTVLSLLRTMLHPQLDQRASIEQVLGCDFFQSCEADV